MSNEKDNKTCFKNKFLNASGAGIILSLLILSVVILIGVKQYAVNVFALPKTNAERLETVERKQLMFEKDLKYIKDGIDELKERTK